MVGVGRRISEYQSTAQLIERGGLLMLNHREDNCSRIRSSLIGRRAARAFSRQPVFLAALVSLVAMGISERAQAQCPLPPGQHAFGLSPVKICPLSAGLGELVTCTITLENQDCDHSNTILSLTEELIFPGEVPVNVLGCATNLAPNDNVAGSGPAFTSCTVSFTVPNDLSLCGGSLTDQVVVTFQDDGLPLVNTNQASGITLIICECGDDIVNTPDETCDGTVGGILGCSAETSGQPDACRPSTDPNDPCTCCGDGIIDASSSETCDGGNDATCNQPCRSDCSCCGDGIPDAGEFCDDGNTNDTDACRNDCTACGDGIVNGGEFCDDGNTNDNDACRNDCTACGDGVINGPPGEEQCEPPNVGLCDANCQLCAPNISIIKTAGTAPDGTVLQINPGDMVVFSYFVCNTGTCPLTNVEVTDDNGTPGNTADDFTVSVGNLAIGECTTVTSNPITIPSPPTCTSTRLNIACVNGTAPDGSIVSDCDDAELCTPPICGDNIVNLPGEECDGTDDAACPGQCQADCTCPRGGEGCTPGYWKQADIDNVFRGNTQHYCNWDDAYEPGDLFASTCADCDGTPATLETCFVDGFGKLGGFMLIEVLHQPKSVKPPQLRNLGFHTVAALLNAATDDVSFGLSECQVIEGFNAATAAGVINDAFNDFKTKVSNFNECGNDPCGPDDPHCCPIGNCRCSDSGDKCLDESTCTDPATATCGGRNEGGSDCCVANGTQGCDDSDGQSLV
ncbi:MAG: hypothetical protein IH897_14690, partial [Planctomycetes bacterium]|nr:hypothetical protein [Planctomycetota bacterium]